MTRRWLVAVGWGLAGVAGCDATCSRSNAALPIVGGTAEQRAGLDDVWHAFAEAWAPADVCVSGVRVGGALRADAGGRYRTVDRRIVLQEVDPGQQADLAYAFGHELCHAWDLQIADAPPNEAWFHFADVAPARGREDREAFATACGLGPAIVARTAAVACGASPPEAGLAHVAGEVFPSAPDPGPDTQAVHTEVALPASVSGAEALEACEVDGGPLAVGFRQGRLVRWFELHDEGLVEVDDGWCGHEERTEPVAWTRSVLGPQVSVAAEWAGTQVAWVQVPWPAGPLHRVWVRRAGADWRSSALSCGLPREPWPGLFSGGRPRSDRTTFLASTNGLVSLSLGDGELHVVAW